MNVEIVNREVDFYVLDVKTRSDNKGKEYLKWDYKNAAYFIVLKLAVDFDLNLIKNEKVASLICSKLCESFDTSGKPYQGEIDINNDIKMNIISLSQYKRTNSWYYDPQPMQVVVLCCEQKDDTIRIHMPEEISASSAFIPEKVSIRIFREAQTTHSNRLIGKFKGFFGQQEQPVKDLYSIKISSLSSNYIGGISYRIKGQKTVYPVTKKMSSSIFKVEVPIGKELEFFVEHEKMKQYHLFIN